MLKFVIKNGLDCVSKHFKIQSNLKMSKVCKFLIIIAPNIFPQNYFLLDDNRVKHVLMISISYNNLACILLLSFISSIYRCLFFLFFFILLILFFFFQTLETSYLRGELLFKIVNWIKIEKLKKTNLKKPLFEETKTTMPAKINGKFNDQNNGMCFYVCF